MTRLALLAVAALLVFESPIPAIREHAPTPEKSLIATMAGSGAVLHHDGAFALTAS